MKRRTARVLALVAIAMIALAAPTLVAADNVTLSVWLGPNNTDAARQIFDDYTKATGIQFDQTVFPVPFEQNLLAKWATGERPDILQFHAIGNWLVQLNPEQNLIDQSDMPFVKNTVAGLLDRAAATGASITAPSSIIPSSTVCSTTNRCSSGWV